MNSLSCVIVDDEPQNQQVLAKMIDKFCPFLEIAGIASTTNQAAELIEHYSPDIVFLDIEIPRENGFTLFDKVNAEKFQVIFTTAHADYAIKAIKFAALDYLLKPISLTELRASIEKASEKQRSKFGEVSSTQEQINFMNENSNGINFDFQKIALPTDTGLSFYNLKDILRCQADKAYCIFHFVDGKRLVVSKCLKEYEGLLAESNFLRVHKSNMINLTHVDKYIKGNAGTIILSDKSRIDVSVRKKKYLLEAMSK